VYGHLSELDHQPRIRMGGEANDGWVERGAGMRSIGVDGACCHGGNLIGYIIETGKFEMVKAQKDWATELNSEMKGFAI
jgi:hypothetical protein